MLIDRRPSGFELALQAAPPGLAVIQERVTRYDPSNAMLYSPIEYRQQEIAPCVDVPPDDEWIGKAFVQFVRGEFGTSSTRGDVPPEISEPVCPVETDQQAYDYLDLCERAVYSGVIETITADAPAVSDRLYALVTHRLLGNDANRRNVSKDDFAQLVDPLNNAQLRLQFVMPSFPFKDQNPFRTEAPASHVDLGEIAMLVRLHALSLAMYQVHPFGADWLLVSDGLAYASIFRVGDEEATKYFRTLVEYRNRLNMQGTVSIIDLVDMTGRISSQEHGRAIFDVTTASIAKALKRLVEHAPEAKQSFAVLTRGMKWNMNTRDFLADVGRSNLWLLLNTQSQNEVGPTLRSHWTKLDVFGQEAALRYASFNLATTYHSLYERVLPGRVRSTVHAKPGQIAAPSTGPSRPWNGVCVVRQGGKRVEDFESLPLHDLVRKYPRVIPRRIRDQQPAFYYEC